MILPLHWEFKQDCIEEKIQLEIYHQTVIEIIKIINDLFTERDFFL